MPDFGIAPHPDTCIMTAGDRSSSAPKLEPATLGPVMHEQTRAAARQARAEASPESEATIAARAAL